MREGETDERERCERERERDIERGNERIRGGEKRVEMKWGGLRERKRPSEKER